MDAVTLLRAVGLTVCVVIFVLTVVLMPWIFGVNPPPEAAAKGDDQPGTVPAPAVPAPVKAGLAQESAGR